MNQAYILLMKKYHTISSLSLQILVYAVALGTLFPEMQIITSLRQVITSRPLLVAGSFLGLPIIDVVLREVVGNDE